jgi:hypothetical protein
MQVAETIAGLHGLKMQVTPTTTLVSRYYKTDRVEGSLDQFAHTTTEWDLLIYAWLRREPEISWVDNAEVIGDLVAVDVPVPGYFFAKKTQYPATEILEIWCADQNRQRVGGACPPL